MNSKQLFQVLKRQVHLICMTDNDVKSVKKTIFTGVRAAREKSNIEVIRRLVDTTARYIIQSYKEVEGELEEVMETEQLISLDPSTNSNIFKSIEEIRVEQLEDTMDIYVERLVSDEVPVKELIKLITKYRYILKRIIKNKEIIKKELWKQLQNNKVHQEVYLKTGPTVELAKGPKNSKEELLFGGGFQKGTKKEALLGKNLQLKESRTSADLADSRDTIHNNQKSEYYSEYDSESEYDTDSDDSDAEYDTDSDEESDTESSGPKSDETSEFLYDEDGGEYYAEPYRECGLCLTPFIQYGEMYCNGGCPIEALNKLDSDELEYKNKETSNQLIALENVTDTTKNNCTNNSTNITNNGDTSRSEQNQIPSELIQHVMTDVTPTTSLVPTFNQPGLAPNFIETVMERKVCLEKAFMESPSVIYGVVRVLNIAFNKSVTVRWTVNDWATHKEMDCKYVQGSSTL